MQSAQFDVFKVNKSNFYELLPTFFDAVTRCAFISVDCEFSGLGNRATRKRLFAKNVEDRYKTMVEETSRRALLQMGVSCFLPTDDRNEQYQPITFCFDLYRTTDFVVSPDSLRFLAEAGLDLNAVFMQGVPYQPPACAITLGDLQNASECARSAASSSAKGTAATAKEMPSMQLILAWALSLCGGDSPQAPAKPMVVHNGFLDLAFILSSFFEPLPRGIS